MSDETLGTTRLDGRQTQNSSVSPLALISRMPSQNFGWAAVALVFFWPLGFAAFTYASKVLPLWLSGEYSASRRASDDAKNFGQAALLVAFVLMVVAVMLSVMFSAWAADAASAGS